MATAPDYFTTILVGAVVGAGTANANRNGTGTVDTIVTAGSSGSRIRFVTFKAVATSTAGTLRLFVHNGSAYFLLAEITVIAITASATQPAFETTYYMPEGLDLPASYSLRFSTEKAEVFHAIAFGASK